MHSNELVDRLVRMKCNVGACVYAQSMNWWIDLVSDEM